MDPIREKRRKELIRELKALVPDIVRDYSTVTKIWIIGSVAKPIFFDMRSDIDIVVDGLPKERYFDLYRFLEGRISSKLDLILLNDIEEKDKVVLENKVVVYEKTFV